MKNKLLLLLIPLLSVGCCPCRHITDTHDQKDSVRTEIIERVVEVHDTAFFEVPVEKLVTVVPSSDTSIQETSFALSVAFVDSVGMLHHSIENKPQTVQKPIVVYVPVADTNHYESHEKQEQETVTEYIEKPLHWWQIALMWIGAIALLFGILWLLVRLKILNLRR
jgi:hypothetical protein